MSANQSHSTDIQMSRFKVSAVIQMRLYLEMTSHAFDAWYENTFESSSVTAVFVNYLKTLCY
jgi:hypothetical protein